MARVNMSAPWVIFYREIESLFREDPEVRVIYDEDNNIVKLYVDNSDKAYALAELLPKEKIFGSVTLSIDVIPANGLTSTSVPLLTAAFKGNSALSYIKTIRGIFTNDLTYVVFRNTVVQYFNDSLADVNGMCSTLYQEIAKDIFEEQEGIFYCTDVKRDGLSLGRPLGEWP